ncbi:MAG: hypothetical protein QF672_10355 [SAR202 cluster bacterium]|nr:hypothetical protein [SAR202 cluster bacterium]
MSRSKFILVLALLFVLALPAAVQAQEPVPVLISVGAPEGTGTAVISDGASLGDSVTITMADVTAPDAGMEYVAYLVSDDGAQTLNLGALTVGADGSVSHTFDSSSANYDGGNLIAMYSTLTISSEAEGTDPAAPSGDGVFGDSLPIAGMAHVRHLLISWPADADMGILPNLQAQLDAAIEKAQAAANSLTIEDVQLNAQAVIDIIEAADTGVLAHAADRSHAALGAAGDPDNTVMAAHAAALDVNGANAEMWAAQARDIAAQVVATSNLTLAKILLGPGGNTVVSTLQAARNGYDSDSDGTIESIANEGGADQAYVEAQMMATYSIVAGPVAPVATPTPVPTATPEPTATPAAAPQPAGPGRGLPSVGDNSVPLAAQLGLLAAIAMLGAGGILMIRGRKTQ